MRGNRATQKSGLDEVVSFFHLRGSDVFHLFPPCFTPFPLTLRVGPTHPHPLLNIFFPSSQQCLNHPTELGPPPCVFANLPSLCVVCHFVNVYPTPPLFFLHITIFSPRLSAARSAARSTKRPPPCRTLVSRASWSIPHPSYELFKRTAL